jgi:hypothetical protein
MGIEFAGGTQNIYSTNTNLRQPFGAAGFTMMAWARLTDTSKRGVVLGCMDEPLAYPYIVYGYRLILYEATHPTLLGRIEGYLGTGIAGTTFSRRGTTNAGDGKWHHLAMSWDGSANRSMFKLWVDGLEEAISYEGGSMNPGFSPCTTNPFRIGYYHQNGDGYTVISYMQIADVRIYDTDMSAYIPAIYAGQGADFIQQNLRARWRLDGPDSVVASGANSLIDINYTGLHLTPSGNPVYAAAPLRLYAD